MNARIHTERAPALSNPWPFFGMAELFCLAGLASLVIRPMPAALGLFTLPRVVAVVHLFTLGTVAMAMMGALYQWIPVVVNGPSPTRRMVHLQFVLFTVGVLSFVAGVQTEKTPLLALGGVVLESGILLFLRNVAVMGLVRRVRLPDTAFVASGLGYLAGTAIVGGFMAAQLATGRVVPAAWLAAHLILGVGGFCGFVLTGVSYRLMPMFLPAPSHPARSGWVLGMAHGAVVTSLLGVWVPGFPRVIPLFLLTATVFVYLLDVGQYWIDRRRRSPDGFLLLMAASHLGLAAAATTAVIAGLSGQDLWPGTIGLAILGWYLLALLAFSQKILPFMAWLHGMRAGRRRTPHVNTLWPPHYAWAASVAAAAGSLGLTAGILEREPLLVRGSALLLGAAVLSFHVGYWRMLGLVRQ